MSHSERKLLPFPREHVFCVVADVRSYPQFVPWVVRSRIITESPRYAEAELAVGFHLLSEKYVSRITMDPPKRLVVRAWLCWGGGAHAQDWPPAPPRRSPLSPPQTRALNTRLFHHLTNEWTFDQGPSPDMTWLSFSVDFSFRSPLYTAAASVFFDEVTSKMVGAFETRCAETWAARKAEAAAAEVLRPRPTTPTPARTPSRAPPPTLPSLW